MLVLGGLFLIQGGGDDPATTPPRRPRPTPDNSPPSVAAGDDLGSIPPATAGDPTGSPTSPDSAPASSSNANSGGGSAASLVAGTTYSLALPKGWERTDPPSGATFAAGRTERRRRRDLVDHT